MLSKQLSSFMLCTLFFLQSQQARAFSWSNAFGNAMTGAHWFLLTVPFLGRLHVINTKTVQAQEYPDVPVEMDDYIKSALKKHGCTQDLINDIQLKFGGCFEAHYSLSGKHIITVVKELAESPKTKAAVEALIRHEAAHLEHKDMLRMGALLAFSPILIHFLFNGITSPISHMLQPHIPAGLQALLKLPVAFIKVYLVVASMVIFSKYKEYYADKKAAESIKDPEVLKAMAGVCMTAYEEYESKQKLDPKERGTWQRFILDELKTEDLMHPNYLLRSQIFTDAVKKLEKTPHITTERSLNE
jgi:hypothetical protein